MQGIKEYYVDVLGYHKDEVTGTDQSLFDRLSDKQKQEFREFDNNKEVKQ